MRYLRDVSYSPGGLRTVDDVEGYEHAEVLGSFVADVASSLIRAASQDLSSDGG